MDDGLSGMTYHVHAISYQRKSLFQVTYLNHKHFNASRKKPKPSPVRIFNNLALPGFELPSKEGYKLCETCNRYVAKENAHCDKCGTCSSKVSLAV